MSLNNLVEQLNIESLPQIAPKKSSVTKIPSEININNIALEIVSLFQREDDWKKEDCSLNLELELIDPNNKVLNTGKFTVPFLKGFKRMRYRTKMQGFKVTSPGEYKIKLKMEENGGLKEIADLPLDVKFQLKFD